MVSKRPESPRVRESPPALRLNEGTPVQNKAHKDVLDLVIYCRDRTKLRKLRLSLREPSLLEMRGLP